jgi:RimJ/RimL family protein N-acetyltransferase
VPKINIKVDFLIEDKSKLIDWLREYHVRFPWMYLGKELQTAQAGKHIFVAILHEENIIGYCKIGINHTYIHDFDKIVHLPQGVAFIYDTFVLPEHRGKNVALYAIIKTIHYLKEKRFHTVWCHIEEWNRASLKLYQKAGFNKKASIRFCRLFGFEFFIKNKYYPLIHLDTFIQAKDREK